MGDLAWLSRYEDFVQNTIKIGKAQNILYFYFGLIEEAIEFSDLFFNTGEQEQILEAGDFLWYSIALRSCFEKTNFDILTEALKITDSSECYIYTSKLDFMRLIHDLAKLGKDSEEIESDCVTYGKKIAKVLSKMLVVIGNQTRTSLRTLASVNVQKLNKKLNPLMNVTAASAIEWIL